MHESVMLRPTTPDDLPAINRIYNDEIETGTPGEQQLHLGLQYGLRRPRGAVGFVV